MGIYVPDVKLPPDKKYKWDLVLHISYDGTVRSPWGDLITDEKAIELPPHGRLIDADAFNRNIANLGMKYDPFMAAGVIAFVNDAPTIIPADPEKEETT